MSAAASSDPPGRLGDGSGDTRRKPAVARDLYRQWPTRVAVSVMVGAVSKKDPTLATQPSDHLRGAGFHPGVAQTMRLDGRTDADCQPAKVTPNANRRRRRYRTPAPADWGTRTNSPGRRRIRSCPHLRRFARSFRPPPSSPRRRRRGRWAGGSRCGRPCRGRFRWSVRRRGVRPETC